MTVTALTAQPCRPDHLGDTIEAPHALRNAPKSHETP